MMDGKKINKAAPWFVGAMIFLIMLAITWVGIGMHFLLAIIVSAVCAVAAVAGGYFVANDLGKSTALAVGGDVIASTNRPGILSGVWGGIARRYSVENNIRTNPRVFGQLNTPDADQTSTDFFLKAVLTGWFQINKPFELREKGIDQMIKDTSKQQLEKILLDTLKKKKDTNGNDLQEIDYQYYTSKPVIKFGGRTIGALPFALPQLTHPKIDVNISYAGHDGIVYAVDWAGLNTSETGPNTNEVIQKVYGFAQECVGDWYASVSMHATMSLKAIMEGFVHYHLQWQLDHIISNEGFAPSGILVNSIASLDFGIPDDTENAFIEFGVSLLKTMSQEAQGMSDNAVMQDSLNILEAMGETGRLEQFKGIYGGSTFFGEMPPFLRNMLNPQTSSK